MRLKRWEIALLASLLAVLLVCAFPLQVQSKLADKLTRLHVLANSDSTEDQQLKLQVRDAVYAATEEILIQSESQQQAVQQLQEALPHLQQLAQQTLRQQGSAYTVTLRLEETEFPYKEYDGFALPAGKYLALRVLIGEAQGANWWCVVFPPLCSAGAEQLSQTAQKAGFTPEEITLLTEGRESLVLRFRFLECLRRLWRA